MEQNLTVNERAEIAINKALLHYFTNLTEGEGRKGEAVLIADFIAQAQPWLFATEQSLTEFNEKVHSEPGAMNLIQNLTVLFFFYFAPHPSEYDYYVRHLVDALCVDGSPENKVSIIKPGYRARVPMRDQSLNLFMGNRFVITLASLIMMADTSIITSAITVR